MSGLSDDEGGSGNESEEEVPQEEKDQELFDAAKCGDLSRCKTSLDNGASATHTGGDGWTPLLWASCNGHVNVAELLIGAPYNAGDPYVARGQGSAGGFGLNAAVNDGEEEGKGNDNGGSSSSSSKEVLNSPLHWASFKGHLHIVWALLKIGVSPYDTDSCGNTSLHLAATGGSFQVLKCLMSEGFDLSQKNVYGNTA